MKINTILIGIFMVLLLTLPASASDKLYGDANEDGVINMQDVTKIERIIMEYDEPTETADANQDGMINMLDVTYIELIILKKVQNYPLRLGLSKSEFKQMSVFAKPWGDACFFGFTHVGLVVYDPDMNIAPGLAEDWEIAPNGKSIMFHLVENAKWHDGTPITAEDGAFNFEYWKKNKLWSQGRWYDSYLDHVDVLDDYTFEVFFTEPVAEITLMTYIPATRFVPRHIWEEIEEPLEYDDSDALIGNGPFIFDGCDIDAQVAYLKANPDYFAGKPSVDRIEWHYYRTLDTLLLALKKGEIDALFDYYIPVPGVYAADLIKAADVDLCIVPDVGTPLHLIFGYRQYPTDMKEFRQAVSYAIDYQAIVDMIAAGYGEVAGKGYTPPTVPGHNPDLPELEYDPEKAKEILDNAGFIDIDGDGLREAPDGSQLQIPILPYPHIVGAVRAAEVINRHLEKVGLDTSVEVESWEIVREKVFWGDRNYNIVIGYATPFGNLAPPSGATYFVDMPGLLGTCNDEELTGLVENIIYSKDIEEMESWVSKVQEYVAEEQPAIALIWGDAIYPYRTDRWNGWVPMNGYGPVNYWTWFNLKPAAS